MVRRLAIAALVACASSCTPAAPQPPPAGTAPETPPADAADPCAGVDDVPPAQLARLTPTQYANSVRDLARGDLVTSPLPKPVSLVPTELEVEAFTQSAHALVQQGVHRAFLRCAPDDPHSANRLCVERFVGAFGRRLFRRPLTADERAALLARFDALSADPAFDPPLSFREKIDALAEVMLNAPQFLYVHDDGVAGTDAAGTGTLRTSGYERATRLSLFLFDRAPDEALLETAAHGGLDTDDGLRAAASQMVLDVRARPVVRRFASAWLGLNGSDSAPSLEQRAKSAASFPLDSPELRGAMRDEVESLYERVFFDGDGRFSSVFTTTDAKLTPALAQLYGRGWANGWTELEGDRRAGILTRAAFVTQFAGPEVTSPIRRGAQLYRNVLGLPLGDPPANANLTAPAPGGDAARSTREASELRTSAPACQGCHGLINPLGDAFEHYDALGGWRDTEDVVVNGETVTVPIDAATEQRAFGVQGSFDGAVALSARIGQSVSAHQAHAARWFASAVGREVQKEDACTLSRIQSRFAESDDLRGLLVDVATSAPTRWVRLDVSDGSEGSGDAP